MSMKKYIFLLIFTSLFCFNKDIMASSAQGLDEVTIVDGDDVNFDTTSLEENNGEIEGGESVNSYLRSNNKINLGKKYSGFLEGKQSDTYEFTTKASGLVSIKVKLLLYGNVYLKDADNKTIVSWSNQHGSESNPKTLEASRYLEAGTYSIVVSGSSSSSSGKYELEANIEDTKNNEIEPNNTFAKAQELSFNKTVRGLISWSDSMDIFKVTLSNAGLLEISNMFMLYGSMYLLDSDGNQIDSQTRVNASTSSPITKKISHYLEKGTYYIKVTGANSSSRGLYELSAKFTKTNNNEKETNNSLEKAQSIKIGDNVTGLISWNDSTDIYKFTLTRTEKVELKMTNNISLTELILMDSKGNNLYSNSYIYADNVVNINKTLNAGTYYIKVNKRQSKEGTYQLSLSNAHVKRISYFRPENGKLYVDGYSYIKGINIPNQSNIIQKLKFVDVNTGKQVKTYELPNFYSTAASIDKNHGAGIYNYDWAKFRGYIDISDLAKGEYYIKIYTNAKGNQYDEIINFHSSIQNFSFVNKGKTFTFERVRVNNTSTLKLTVK